MLIPLLLQTDASSVVLVGVFRFAYDQRIEKQIEDLSDAWHNNGIQASIGDMNFSVSWPTARKDQAEKARDIAASVAKKDSFTFIRYPFPQFGKPELSRGLLAKLLGPWRVTGYDPGSLTAKLGASDSQATFDQQNNTFELKPDGTCLAGKYPVCSGTWQLKNHTLTLYIHPGWPIREYKLEDEKSGFAFVDGDYLWRRDSRYP